MFRNINCNDHHSQRIPEHNDEVDIAFVLLYALKIHSRARLVDFPDTRCFVEAQDEGEVVDGIVI